MNAHIKMMNHLVIIHLLVLDAKTFLAGTFPCAAVVNSSVQLLLCCVAINVKEIIQVCLNNVSVLKKKTAVLTVLLSLLL